LGEYRKIFTTLSEISLSKVIPVSSLSSSLDKQFLNDDEAKSKSKSRQKKLTDKKLIDNLFDQKWSTRKKRSYYNDQSSSGFQPYMQSSQTIEFLSTFNFSDPMDGSADRHAGNFVSEDPTPILPVTEMSDFELKRLGFPVPATTTESSIYSILHGFGGSGSGHDLSSVIDSPYIKFTSRKYEKQGRRSGRTIDC